MNGTKERLMILDMISEGKITAAEGEELFRALDVTDDPSAESADPMPAPPQPPFPPLAPLPPLSPRRQRDSADLVAALKSAGIDHVTLSDVQEMQDHGLTSEYINEMLALGIEPDGLGEWIHMRNHDISPR